MTTPKIVAACLTAALTTTTLTIASSADVGAVSAWDYNPGNIISDAAMRNYNSMNQAAIQSFLKSKNSCNDTRTYIASWYPSVYYHIENGHFVCMADETFNGKSAAEIIYRAAQDYKINPQVLIVMLQKEQGLVTDTYPHNLQYRSATGYGCPDYSACESKYYGLENQVRNTASLFNDVLNGGWTNYPVGSRYVLYSPRTGCGGATINIENKATSALYRYTPYQPNDAAKNAGYGSGDWCSTYGNRNFFLYFNDWFGSSTTASTAEYHGAPISASDFYLPEGNYQFLTTTGRALDVAGAGTGNGTNVQIYTKNDTVAQTFHISREPDGFYKIANPHSGKVLDVSNADTKNGANIQLWEPNGTCAQKWSISMQDNYYVFKNACSGNAIDVAVGRVSTPGANVQAYQYNQTKAQTWRLVNLDDAPIRGGTYNLQTAEGKTVMDVISGGTANGTGLHTFAYNKTDAQKFKLSRGSDGFYRIYNAQADKSVDVASASHNTGAKIQLWDNNDTCAQKWAPVAQGDGKNGTTSYAFRNACSGKALDVKDGAINASSIKIWLYDYNQTKAQQWTLVGRR